MDPKRLTIGIVSAALVGTLIAALRADALTATAVAAANAIVLAAAALLARREPELVRPAIDERVAAMTDRADELVVVVDLGGRISYVSAGLRRLLGWTVEEFAGLSAEEYIHADDWDSVLAALREAQADADGSVVVGARVRARNGWRPVSLTLRNALADPVVRGFVITQTDAGDDNQVEAMLAIRSTQQEAIARLGRRALAGAEPGELAAEAVTIVVDGLGVTRGALFRSVRGHDELLLVATAGDDTAGEPRAVPLDRSTLVWNAVLDNQALCATADGSVVPVDEGAVTGSALAVPVTGRRCRYGVITVRSLTPREFSVEDVHFLEAVANSLALALERRGAEEAANTRALHDPLTGLPNRVLFLDRVERALDDALGRGTTTAVFFIDLDHFKRINDTMGHAGGDAILNTVARRLTDTLRPGDLVARFGGDEFTVLCEHLRDPAQAERIAERIAASLAPPTQVGDRPIHITASIGFVLSEGADPGDRADELVQWADAAMYEAKQEGRARIRRFRRSGGRAPVLERSGDELRRAIAAGQLFCDYQAIVELPSERVVVAEALVRWRHPQRGVLTPDEFIPESEASGVIDEVDRWVLEQAMRQAVAWNEHGLEIMTAVNLSPREVVRADFGETVRSLLERTRCRPEWICLEIPESVIVTDLPAVAYTIHELKDIGVQIALDDFGSGYSSLTYLRRLPIDVLKIHKSIVEASAENTSEGEVTAALVQLAHSLGMAVSAVGVETRAELRVLAAMGCNRAQGFLLSRPAPAAETTALVPRADLAADRTVVRSRSSS